MPSVAILSYGCTANQSQAEIIAGLLRNNGFGIASQIDGADAVIINSCIVKSTTENKVKSAIRRVVGKNKPLVITGCIADKQMLRSIAPNASLVNSHNVTKIADVVSRTLSGSIVEELEMRPEPKLLLPKLRENPITEKIEIAQGCLGACTYCITRLAKGRLVSYPLGGITDEARQALAGGCREIYLTAQDTGCYGLDSGTSLPELLRSVTALPGDFFVRVGMMNPDHAIKIADELLDVYRNGKMYKFLHLPVQSGADSVLERMARGYDSATFASLCGKFREEVPNLTLSTDVIVGFPGETDADFEETVKLIEKVRPDVTNISRFGPRPGTPAARMKMLDMKVISSRSALLTLKCREISRERNESYLGQELPVLVTEKRDNGFLARANNFKQVFLRQTGLKAGDFAKAEIIGAFPHALFGKI